MSDPTVLAYLAGVVDSDGYVTAAITKHKGRQFYGAAIGIAGTRREPHDLAASLFGGNVRTYIPRGNREHHRPQFQWQRYGRSALPVIEAIRPYLRVKAEQADLAIELEEMADEAREMRDQDDPYPWFGPDFDPAAQLGRQAAEIRALNLRGVRVAVTA
ncbi:hypothetical protein ACGFIW_01920 [Micromonospora sp. NPDC048935]|uniref:hypothetical protein n=1 Tax=Micromonospora sp. NPDC048935 TaxID=3364262 RepID=UPI0037108350